MYSLDENAGASVGIPSHPDTPVPIDPDISFSVVSQVVSEGDGLVNIQVVLSSIRDVPTLIAFSAQGSARATFDYSINTPSPIIIPTGHAAVSISIQLVDDVAAENLEELIFTLSSSEHNILGTSSHTIKIADNDGGPVNIYRSVGPLNIGALASGGANTISILNSTATFDSDLPLNVGSGDVIQYDADNDGDYDNIAFIYARLRPNKYYIQSAGGGASLPTSANSQNWKIYRAYTSLNEAQNGVENVGLLSGVTCEVSCAALANFDSRTTGINLVSANVTFNFVTYADAIDTTNVDISNWITDNTRYVKIYAPSKNSEVGVSQRHQGFWGSGGYELNNTGSIFYSTLNISSDDVRIEGLKIGQGVDSGNFVVRVDANSAMGTFYLDSCLVTKTVPTFTGGSIYALYISSGGNINFRNYISNNIFYGVNDVSHPGATVALNSTSFLYNNTIITADEGVVFYGPATAKNNIVQGSTGNSYIAFASFVADYNVSNTPFTYGSYSSSNDKTNAVVNFVNIGIQDYRLNETDTTAKANGVDLSTDVDLAIFTDIQGIVRGGTWDIGASVSKP